MLSYAKESASLGSELQNTDFVERENMLTALWSTHWNQYFAIMVVMLLSTEKGKKSYQHISVWITGDEKFKVCMSEKSSEW